MNNQFLSIYEVATILGLHHKTVRGFISSGKLKATKVGKQWRITKEDLDVFMGKDTTFDKENNTNTNEIDFDSKEVMYTNKSSNESQIKNRISISAVVDIQAVNKMKFERMSNTLLAVVNSKDVKMEGATIHLKYEEAAMVCKVFLWGSAAYINELLSIITLLDKEDSNESYS